MPQKSPLTLVKEKFGEKAKLVEAVKGFVNDDLWLARTASDRGKTKGLEHVSNAKLLRLHETFSQVKDQFGTRAKLIDAVLDAEGRAKDPGYRARLEAYPVPRLFDALRSAQRRAKRAAAKPEKKAEQA